MTVLAPDAVAPPGWRGKILSVSAPWLLRKLKGFFGRQAVTPSTDLPALNAVSVRRSVRSRVKAMILATGVGSSVRWPDPSGLWFRAARAALGARLAEFDVVVSTFGPPGAHLLADWAKKRRPSLFWVADFRDPWTKNFHFPGVFGLRWIERHLERGVLRRADLLTTVSGPLARDLEALAGRPVSVIFNGYDPADWDPAPGIPRRDGGQHLFYGGSYYPGRMRVDLFLRALAELRHEGALNELSLRVEFRGSRTEEIVAQAQEMGLADVVIGGGILSRSDALRSQRAADWLLFFGYQDETLPDQGILTGKLFEYMGSGARILGLGLSENIEAGRLILSTGRGVLAASTVESMKAALQKVLAAPTQAAVEVQKTGPFTRAEQSRKLLRLMEETRRDTRG